MKKVILYFMFLTVVFFSATAQRTVSGNVTDDSGESLPGVNVVIKGTTTGTTTDLDGNYRLSVDDDDALIFSFVGFETYETNVGARSIIDVAMGGITELEEVVVTAVGITREKEALGYAVSQIDSDDIVGSQEVNLAQGLAAKAAGVRVTSGGAGAGASASVRIRGATSINRTNEPLYVVDGIPINNNYVNPPSSGGLGAGTGGGTGGGTAGVANSNRLIDMNPNDIASLTVLKGAAATALYGLRAANGVIVITTKSGSARGGRPRVGYEVSYGFEQIGQTPSLQQTYAQGSDAQYLDPSSGQFASFGTALQDLRFNGATDYKWDKNGKLVDFWDEKATDKAANSYDPYDFFITGNTFSNDLSVSGGNERFQYYSSVSHLRQNSTIPKNFFERTTFRLNSALQLAPKVKISNRFQYTNSGGNRVQQGSNISGLMLGLTRTPPSFDNSNGFGKKASDEVSAYEFPDGTQRNYRGGGGYDNPYWLANNIPYVDDVNRIIVNAQLEYQPWEFLTLIYKYGIDHHSDKRSNGFSIGSRTAPAGRILEDDITSLDYYSEFQALFNKTFNKITVSAILGQNTFGLDYERQRTQGDGYALPKFHHVSNASSVSAFNNFERNRNDAIYFSADADYDGLIYVGGSLRNDWSSTLPEANNSFVSYSANLSFVFSNLLQSDVLNFGKLRASFGSVGNDAPVFATQSYFEAASFGGFWTDGLQFPFNGSISGFHSDGTLGNTGLVPERTTSSEFGFELGFLNSRINVDFNYYTSISSDQIVEAAISGATGYRFQFINAGDIKNSGIEMEISGDVIRSADLTWNIALNWNNNVSKVSNLPVNRISLTGFTSTSSSIVNDAPYGAIYTRTWERDDNGNIVIGEDGFPKASGENEYFGDPNPDWLGGFRNTLTYKGFTFSFLLDVRMGGEIWNGTKGALTTLGRSELSAQRGNVVVFTGVTEGGAPNTKEVVLSQAWFQGNGGGFGDVGEQFVETVNWLRVRDIKLSYTLPSSLFSKNKVISGVSIELAARNPFLWTNYDGVDPDTNLTGATNGFGLDYFNNPNTRTYTSTLSVNF